MDAVIKTAAIFLTTFALVGCDTRSHEFTVSTDLDFSLLMDAADLSGAITVHDSTGFVGEIRHITLTGDGTTELLIGTDRSEYSPSSWTSLDAKLRTDGTVWLAAPDETAN